MVNCGITWVGGGGGKGGMGGYKKIVWFYQLCCYCKLAAVKSSKADVSSFSPYDNQLMSLTH